MSLIILSIELLYKLYNDKKLNVKNKNLLCSIIFFISISNYINEFINIFF